jgi:hypothetical protein
MAALEAEVKGEFLLSSSSFSHSFGFGSTPPRSLSFHPPLSCVPRNSRMRGEKGINKLLRGR